MRRWKARWWIFVNYWLNTIDCFSRDLILKYLIETNGCLVILLMMMSGNCLVIGKLVWISIWIVTHWGLNLLTMPLVVSIESSLSVIRGRCVVILLLSLSPWLIRKWLWRSLSMSSILHGWPSFHHHRVLLEVIHLLSSLERIVLVAHESLLIHHGLLLLIVVINPWWFYSTFISSGMWLLAESLIIVVIRHYYLSISHWWLTEHGFSFFGLLFNIMKFVSSLLHWVVITKFHWSLISLSHMMSRLQNWLLTLIMLEIIRAGRLHLHVLQNLCHSSMAHCILIKSSFV